MRNVFAALFFFVAQLSIAQPAQTLYFDPASAIGAPVSRLFESVTYIPLETTRQSLFGQISHLVVTAQYFIVFDYDTQALYFFDKNGKFVKKYKDDKYTIAALYWMQKENALYILQAKSYRLTDQERDELLHTPFTKSTSKYGRAVLYNLNNIEKEQISEMPDFGIFMANPTLLAPGQWAYSSVISYSDAKDTVDFELKISNGQKITKAYFPYTKRRSTFLSDPANIEFFAASQSNTLLFTRPYYNSVYQLTPDSVTVLYNFVLPFENTVPKTFFTKEFSSRNELRDYKQNNPAYAWRINGLIPFHNLLFFSLDYQKRDRRFIFDKSTNRFYNVNKISADSTNAYLPVMGWGIQYYDTTALYSSISSDAMFRSRDAEKHRNPVYSELLTNYFDKSKSTSNPVIIILKPVIKNK
ncbi:6-bladed beta-propeller protein [Lacibacter cauensis]|uniref:6-bladed beta-propeller protein n=1 Tax=Lacibacter cauensis TaxID=510947 RepID=A0A562SJM9_9BACT|nr:6-bladed beta-propeller [Lacibacter cauensis]TWI81194.1 6-bladed beta-propeller protein [Lacibacter cauensis]